MTVNDQAEFPAQAEQDAEPVTQNAVVQAISTVYDPEIPVNIYELGLIYKIDIDAAGKVAIDMTVTAPACPVADILPVEVAEKVRGVPGVSDVRVELVWDPPWNPDMMSESARLELGMF
jgi:FeS assembly SUF system protein